MSYRSYPGLTTRERPIRGIRSIGGRPIAWRDLFLNGTWVGEVVKVERNGKRGWLPIGVKDLAEIEPQHELTRAARMIPEIGAVQVFIYPENERAKHVLIERFKDEIQERRRRRPEQPGTNSELYHYVTTFECPDGHQHRDMLRAAICVGKAEVKP